MVPSLLRLDEVRRMILVLGRTSPGTSRGGRRDVLDGAEDLRHIAAHPNVRAIVDAVLGPEAFVARATLSDKTPDANWKVPWHQDVTIAVKDRKEVEGYGPWSVKGGIVHVQPPSGVLERMITVRIHLDSCDEESGALRVIPASHMLGRLNQNDVSLHVQQGDPTCCSANSGDALVMRPLLLHASSAAAKPTHRRVLHLDYAVGCLDGGLRWRMH